MSDIPYIGSRISLITTYDIRYEGVLSQLDQTESTIAVKNVRSFGTEGRRLPDVPMSNEIYDYIVFSGKDLKDLTVLHENNPVPSASHQADKESNKGNPSSTLDSADADHNKEQCVLPSKDVDYGTPSTLCDEGTLDSSSLVNASMRGLNHQVQRNVSSSISLRDMLEGRHRRAAHNLYLAWRREGDQALSPSSLRNHVAEDLQVYDLFLDLDLPNRGEREWEQWEHFSSLLKAHFGAMANQGQMSGPLPLHLHRQHMGAPHHLLSSGDRRSYLSSLPNPRKGSGKVGVMDWHMGKGFDVPPQPFYSNGVPSYSSGNLSYSSGNGGLGSVSQRNFNPNMVDNMRSNLELVSPHDNMERNNIFKNDFVSNYEGGGTWQAGQNRREPEPRGTRPLLTMADFVLDAKKSSKHAKAQRRGGRKDELRAENGGSTPMGGDRLEGGRPEDDFDGEAYSPQQVNGFEQEGVRTLYRQDDLNNPNTGVHHHTQNSLITQHSSQAHHSSQQSFHNSDNPTSGQQNLYHHLGETQDSFHTESRSPRHQINNHRSSRGSHHHHNNQRRQQQRELVSKPEPWQCPRCTLENVGTAFCRACAFSQVQAQLLDEFPPLGAPIGGGKKK